MDQASWIRTGKEVVAGWAAGCAQVLVGQPFDTIKVRLQTQTIASGREPRYTSAMQCARQTLAREGPTAFYKGTVSPLVGVGLCVSIQFAAVASMKRLFQERHGNQAASVDSLSMTELFISGAVAGVACSVVSGPVEHIRTRLQVQLTPAKGTLSSSALMMSQAASISGKRTYVTAHETTPYRGSVDCVRSIVRNHGMRGLYRGQGVTMARELVGYGCYFLGYDWLLRRMRGTEATQSSAPGALTVMTCGAFGGYCLWAVAFPLDVIKSKMQADGWTAASRQYPNAWQCAKTVYCAEGLRGFYRGFWPCMLRCAPVNAATFLTFDLVSKALGLAASTGKQ